MSKKVQFKNREYLKDVEVRSGSRYKPFSIEPLPHERQRLSTPMSAEDRARRVTWVKDQVLSPDEPRFAIKPENPIKKVYRFPLRVIAAALQPVIGTKKAVAVRNVLGIAVPSYLVALVLWYNLKYRQATWERREGIFAYTSPHVPHISGSHINNQAPPKEYYGEHMRFTARTALKD